MNRAAVFFSLSFYLYGLKQSLHTFDLPQAVVDECCHVESKTYITRFRRKERQKFPTFCHIPAKMSEDGTRTFSTLANLAWLSDGLTGAVRKKDSSNRFKFASDVY